MVDKVVVTRIPPGDALSRIGEVADVWA